MQRKRNQARGEMNEARSRYNGTLIDFIQNIFTVIKLNAEKFTNDELVKKVSHIFTEPRRLTFLIARSDLPDEEYKNLSDVQKYQLSLDRYKERRKPNAWIAGAEYEMYCCYLLRKNGFNVIENGIKMRKSDLGRDIIAYKDGNTYIIQCKRYSLFNQDGTDKYVHENVICQLFGTTIEYQISNPDCTLFAQLNKVVPVLYTTGRLSNMASAFAKRLNVKVIQCEMNEYPMIKCNINNGKKIYHLPFDQQYWNTRIEIPGECYCWTVQEAEEKGFIL